ncbi:MAG: gamma-glutamyltransferase, partial [Fimbriimonadaceae bacterium]|nr:gamma-glutamyltransferase [Alphaproteobacteria bacterium]
LKSHETTSDYYLRDDNPPQTGEIHRLPVLAKTLRAIAAKGRDGFYLGKNAAAMTDTLRKLGGAHTEEDFANVKSDWVDPVLNPYHGTEVAEIPPNTHGITAQLILNILENFDLAALDPHGAARYHIELEAARIAYGFRDAFIADPDYMQVNVEDFLSKDMARNLAGKIDTAKRTDDFGPASIPKGSDTIYLTVVDANWNAISFINSLYSAFGSGITDPTTGVLFHCRGTGFSTDPTHPNFIGPGKRPFHTIIPSMALRDGKTDLSFAVMGGAYQPAGQAHMLSNIYDHGMDIQQAIDHPRIFWEGHRIGVERGVSEPTRRALAALGHDLYECQVPWGGAQGIRMDWERGVLIGGSDARKDGCAIGF